MVQINFANREIQCKVVYYGPGMSGKTTNLEVVHKKAPTSAKGELTSIATEGDRTLFFDFMPLDLGNIAGIKTKFQLYTVPGQVYYNSTRKLVLQGVDGIVFVADSQADKLDENVEAFENLKANLKEYGRDIEAIPMVLQYNKRDLPGAMPVEDLERKLNPLNLPYFEAVASTGEGVFPTLKALASLVLESINREKQGGAGIAAAAACATPAAAATRPAPQRPAAAATARPAAPAAPRRMAPQQQPVQRRPAARVRPQAAPAARTPRQSREPFAAGTATQPRVHRAKPRHQERAEPVHHAMRRPAGKVRIKERTDTARLVLTLVIAAVIIGAVGFLFMNYL